MRSYEMVTIFDATLEDHKLASEEIAEVAEALVGELVGAVSGDDLLQTRCQAVALADDDAKTRKNHEHC